MSATGGEAYEELARALGSKERATEVLRKRGMPGVRYLDGASRGRGEGTRNVVVFDDSLMKIINRE